MRTAAAALDRLGVAPGIRSALAGMGPGVTTRFAPSPTGPLHLGHVHAALFAWALARMAGGRFLLRIEDIDAGRSRPAYAQALQDDLRWLGLDWDGPTLVQSGRTGAYRDALGQLARMGLLYPCFCSRADIAREVAASAGAPHGPDGPPYPGTCRDLSSASRSRRLDAGQPHAWRLDLAGARAALPTPPTLRELGASEAAIDPAPFGDVVLGRRDFPGSYHLCATLDDAAQGVTLVTRATDLRPAAHLHRLLQALLGWPAPAYAHHALLVDAQRRRLSKRDGASPVAALRAAGHTPAAVLAMAAAGPR